MNRPLYQLGPVTVVISLTAAEYDKVSIISLFLQRGFRAWINAPGTVKRGQPICINALIQGGKNTLDLDSFGFGFHNSMKNEWHFVVQTESSGNAALKPYSHT